MQMTSMRERHSQHATVAATTYASSEVMENFSSSCPEPGSGSHVENLAQSSPAPMYQHRDSASQEAPRALTLALSSGARRDKDGPASFLPPCAQCSAPAEAAGPPASLPGLLRATVG